MHDESELGFASLAIRSGQIRTSESEHCEPIFPTSSFVFQSAAQAEARFAEREAGNLYSRFTNPTVRTFQDRLAALEGGEACIATASGMAAILSTCLALLRTGDHIVSSSSLFGSTVSLFTNYLSKFGIATSYVPLTDLPAWEAAIRPGQTKMLYLETPSNPLMEIADIRALAEMAHAHGCFLVVDNCFCTPVLQRPLKLGADLVIHSATKYLDGQGRCIGGAVVGDAQRVGKDVFAFLRTAGPTLSPFNAWVFLKGLETLKLRVRAHSENALQLARWLEKLPSVAKVYYPGLTSHPQHDLACRQQSGFGGIVSFEVHGDRETAWRVVDSTQMISITANLGDAKTTITHPATTTHGRLTQAERDAAGIRDNLLRISVGLEEIADIQADLQRSLG
ncbi:MAG: O-succinylhomoserine sulfhydrylase [Gammaproteobacteria bacterium]|nr:O-succinylhomoserine sulfhydrylase [Gammaproteobacteria bacterium]MCP5424798.1 O-succinylhomoserine sulfhydrylase [Gammaproteobacteria bacterium]MCP5458225.1 O-succinylhomoserine sulfhydrylase [Gammaproteobacteria bacterium]